MRLDKFLKISRLIKRRTVANDACSGGRVTVNGKVAKPGHLVRVGDVLVIRFGDHFGHYEITRVAQTVRKEDAADMYRVVLEDNGARAERD
ncbi:MAG: RNA-binding S4 domain-containing protein [Clostridia bacterium]|nr:RNA-binding S4 domain-containing protein [Clostridia bacterium]